MSITKVVKSTELGSFLDYNNIEVGKLNPVLPSNNLVPISYVPSAVGNLNNKNEFVIDSIGGKWFIDYAGDAILISGTSNFPHYFNNISTNFPLTAQTNTTRVNVTGWGFNVQAGKSYKIEVIAIYTTAAATTGGSIGLITASGAVGNIAGRICGDITNVAAATALAAPLYAVNTINTTAGSFMTTSGLTASAQGSILIEAIFNCTASGSINVQWGTEVASSLAQLRAGSSLLVTLLN